MNTLAKMTETNDDHRSNTGKIAKPDLYRGDRTKLDAWLLQWDLYFKLVADSVDETDRGCLVASYLRDEAQRWIEPYLVKYLDDANEEDDITELFKNFSNFKTRMREVFGTSN